MKDKELLPENGGYKANLHSHTTDSDGYFTPERLKTFYAERGYSILAYTDHLYMRDRSELNDENFVAINGYENNIFDPNSGKCYHLNFYSPKQDKVGMVGIVKQFYDFYMKNKSREQIVRSPVLNGFCSPEHSVGNVNEIIKQAAEQGYLVVYNHPVYNMHDDSDYLGLKGLTGVEVMNYGGFVSGCVENDTPYERMLNVGQRIFPLAGDDNHNYCAENRAFDSFGGFNVMFPERLNYESVFNCLKKGNFYASEGASIRGVGIYGNTVRIGTENAAFIRFSTNSRSSQMAIQKEKPLTQAIFTLPDDISYFRLTVSDEHGKKAYTRAFFKDEWSD